MSSFFTIPASQRKRKRPAETNAPSVKRHTSKSALQTKSPSAKTARVRRDESISGSESDEGAQRRISGDEYASSGDSSESEEEDETGAERRLRLAERYLENIKGEVDEAGFDAEEIDRDLIAERLKEDAVCRFSLLSSSPGLKLLLCRLKPKVDSFDASLRISISPKQAVASSARIPLSQLQ